MLQELIIQISSKILQIHMVIINLINKIILKVYNYYIIKGNNNH